MSANDPSFSDPAAIREQVRGAVAEEAAHRPVDPEVSADPPDLTEIAPGITVADVEDAFRWNQVGDGFLAIKLMRGRFCYDNVQERPRPRGCH